MDELDKIISKNILVIGDVMLDTYYFGDVKRISPEAPVPVFKKQTEKSVLGGAANVASNLVAANQNVYMMTIIGNDVNGESLEKYFLKQGIDTSLIYKSKRKTTVKTRFIADNNQQVMRLDIEDNSEISLEECNILLNLLQKKIKAFDLIIFSDYLKGLLTYEFTQKVIELANQWKIKVIIDVKDPNFDKYKNAYLLKPNLIELNSLTKMPVCNDDEIVQASKVLRENANCEYVLTTCGARGMILVGKDTVLPINSVGKEVYDVTGAGDTTIAYLGACISNDINITEAVKISNFAAGIQVGKVGTAAVYLDEVKRTFNKYKSSQKLISKDELYRFRNEHKKEKIVFTNGCFDIIHAGHIDYLQKASTYGDILIVGINSDESIKRLKGNDRPINTLEDRIKVLSALKCIDYIVPFYNDTPLELIQKIKPDVLVKGADYKENEVVGRDFVEKTGGKLILVELVKGKSTTNIINKIKTM